jgi:hypothetical protein
LDTTIVQSEVLRTAAICTSLTIDSVDVDPTNTAVAVSNGTSIKNHAVPSFAIAHSVDAPVDVVANGKKRFVAFTVFGVVVWYLNVTVFVALIAHDPVNVQIRNTFADRGSSPSRMT